MLSYEIDALVADRFKASWERMVLLATIWPFGVGSEVFYKDDPDDRTVSMGRWYDEHETSIPWFSADSALEVVDIRNAYRAEKGVIEPGAPTWPRTEAESKWKNEPKEGTT